MKRWCLVMTVTMSCGGSQRGAKDPAAQAREAERARIEAMKPAPPYETRAVRGYRAPTTCGQGPYRIEASALGAQFGETFEVNICAPRSLQGDYRLTLGTETREPRHFGSRNNSGYCLATAAEAAQRNDRAVAGSSRGDAGAPGTRSAGSSSSASTPASAPSAAPITLTAVSGSVGESCPAGTYLTGIVDFTSEMETGDGVPWKPGMPLIVDLWSAEPLHLDGAIFVVIQRGVRGGMTAERWTSYRDASAQWTRIWNAYLAGEVTAGRAEYADMTARTPAAPPPPRAEIKPPRPSTHAEWIAGYWQRDREWIWSPGFWRVPEADIVAEQTIEAPVAPPAVKTEAPAAAPIALPVVKPTESPPTAAPPAGSVNLVWTPGYWTWNGSVYIWIDGAWRIPPQGARWVAPSWTSRRGRFVLRPGGWSVHVGR